MIPDFTDTALAQLWSLEGRVAVVTGGGQGIGLACVEALSEAGAHVYIADRNPKAGAEIGRAHV